MQYVVGEEWTADPLEWFAGQGGLEYALTDTEMSWVDAQTYAISRGGQLARAEGGSYLEIHDLFAPDPGSGVVEYWVGALQDAGGVEPDRDWMWMLSGDPVTMGPPSW